jgi:hypothetical protein
MAGWGIGLGGFAQGLTAGVSAGSKMREGFDKREEAERKRAKEDAQRDIGRQGNAAYDTAVQKGEVDPGTDRMDWFAQNYAPKVEQMLLDQGDIESAAKWSKWAEDKKTVANVKQMGQLIGQFHDATATGDFDSFGKSFGKFYNALPESVRQGGTFDSLNVTKDASGNVTGIAATFKSGDKTLVHNWSSLQDFGQSVQGWLSPATLFTKTMENADEAKKYKAGIAKYAAQKGIDLQAKIAERQAGVSGKDPREEIAEIQKSLTTKDEDGNLVRPTDKQVQSALDQRNRLAAQRAPGLGGGSAAPTPAAPAPPKMMLVDKTTGRPVAPEDDAGGPGSPAAITAPAPTPAPQQRVEPAPGPAGNPTRRIDFRPGSAQPDVRPQRSPQPQEAGPIGLGTPVASAQQAPGLGTPPPAYPAPRPDAPNNPLAVRRDMLQRQLVTLQQQPRTPATMQQMARVQQALQSLGQM